VIAHRAKFLIIKLTRCTDFSNLLWEWNSACFAQFLCPSSGIFHCTHSSGILCHTGLLTGCSQAVSKSVWHIPLLCVQWRPPNDGQRSCPKLVEFYSKSKFEKSVHLVGFITRNIKYGLHYILCSHISIFLTLLAWYTLSQQQSKPYLTNDQ
jgi:hypothetical protein